jgi:hypothetical protein
VVSFYRPGPNVPTDPSQFKAFRQESTAGLGNLIAEGWPISLLTGSRGEKASTGNVLPDAGRQPWWNFLCPAIPGIDGILRADDKFMDQNDFKYQISACELTELGYRGTAQLIQG